MNDHISKTIVFKFTNKFTKQVLLIMKIPYLPFWATDGYYSNLFKAMKKAAAFRFDENLVVGKFWIEPQKSNRTLITFQKGVSLDMPYNVTEKDIKIIRHYVEGVKMSLS